MLTSRSDFVLNKIADLETQVLTQEKEAKLLRDDTLELQIVAEVLKEIIEKSQHDEEQKSSELATVALREVFPDHNISFRIEHVKYRNQPGVRFWYNDIDEGFEGDPMDSSGGHRSLLSTVFRILAILRRPNLRRILILDEPFTGASSEYQEAVGRFLKRICHDLDFSILLITHLEGVSDMADTLYSVRKSKEGTVLRRLK